MFFDCRGWAGNGAPQMIFWRNSQADPSKAASKGHGPHAEALLRGRPSPLQLPRKGHRPHPEALLRGRPSPLQLPGKGRRPHPEALLRSKSLEGCSRRRRGIQRAFRLFHTARWNRPSRPLRGAAGRGQLGLRCSSERSRQARLAVTFWPIGRTKRLKLLKTAMGVCSAKFTSMSCWRRLRFALAPLPLRIGARKPWVGAVRSIRLAA
jgi:hypothetical protein